MSGPDVHTRERVRAWARRRTPPPLAVDAAIVLAVLIGQSVPFLFTQRLAGPQAWTVAEYLPVLGASLPLILRRRYPLAVLMTVLASSYAYALNDPDIPEQPIWYGWLVATYTVATLSPPWKRALALCLGVTGALSASFTTFVRGALTTLAAYVLGRSAVQNRAYLELARERAAAHERTRIARDMHDVLAHGVSVMIVQAEAGPVALRTAPEKAEAAFEAIGEAGREAQAQLRRILGLLRSPDQPRDPAPRLARIPELVADVSRTGPAVRLVTNGRVRPLAPDAEVAAYRVVQETLTNVLKHADATAVEVRLDWARDELVISVSDDGTGAARSRPEPGHGLLGLQERVAACGGTARFGPGPRGRGFRAEVRLPSADGAP